MSEPLASRCAYCGSTENLVDDAWWCNTAACWAKAEAEQRAEMLGDTA